MSALRVVRSFGVDVHRFAEAIGVVAPRGPSNTAPRANPICLAAIGATFPMLPLLVLPTPKALSLSKCINLG